MNDFDWSAGLSFEWPVQNRTALGSIRAAQELLELSRISAIDFEAQLRDLVLRASSNITTTTRRVEFGERQVTFAKQNLEAEEARFQVGRTTNNDVLLRQQELKDAEIRLLRATVDQLVSEAALGAATADLLDRYGIRLKGW
jgi:outer membrane protein TolC